MFAQIKDLVQELAVLRYLHLQLRLQLCMLLLRWLELIVPDRQIMHEIDGLNVHFGKGKDFWHECLFNRILFLIIISHGVLHLIAKNLQKLIRTRRNLELIERLSLRLVFVGGDLLLKRNILQQVIMALHL